MRRSSLPLSLSLLSFSLRWLKLEEGRGRDRESVRPPTSRRNGKRQEEESGSKSGDARSRPDRSGRARTEIQPEACDLWKHGGIFIRVHRVHSVGLYLPSSLLLPGASPTSRISPVKTGRCLPRSGQETHAPSSIRYEDYVRIPLSSLGSIHVLDSTYHRDSILKS